MGYLLGLLLAWIPLIAWSAVPVSVHWARVTPDHLFTGEEKSLLITAAVGVPATHDPVTIALLHLTPSGAAVAHRWPMRDDGSFGDARAGDGIYSRKVEFNPRRPAPIHFAVYPESVGHAVNPRDATPPLEAAQRVTVHVAAQPTFIELLGQIWHTLFPAPERSKGGGAVARGSNNRNANG